MSTPTPSEIREALAKSSGYAMTAAMTPRERRVNEVLVEAARLYADLLENGEKVWCVTHDAESIENHGGMTDECWRVVWVTDGEPEAASDLRDFCRMTSVRVVPVSTTEER